MPRAPRRRRTRRALPGIQQGAAAAPTRSGLVLARNRRRRRGTNGNARSKHYEAGLCALTPFHLSLPRPCAPYSVVKATTTFKAIQTDPSGTTDGKVIIFGPFQDDGQTLGTHKKWSNVVAISSINSTVARDGLTNSFYNVLPSPGGTPLSSAGTQLTPAAMTIQIMNPQAVQSTSGIIYVGRLPTQVFSSTGTWKTVADEFVSYARPRLCSAAKLAFNGVQVDLLPSNMSELADFTEISDFNTGTATWDNSVIPCGFLPVCIYNPDAVNLEFLVTVEYRVRFDLSNPAISSHRYHKPSPESWWSTAIEASHAAAHGVRDIAEAVAQFGEVAGPSVAKAISSFV